MSTYKIESWNAVIVDETNIPKPIVYFVPNIQILDHAHKNKYRFTVKLKGTGSAYDNRVFWVTMDKSSELPNCRPNFFEKTGYYVLTLDSSWNGYPSNKGQFQLVNSVLSQGLYKAPHKKILNIGVSSHDSGARSATSERRSSGLRTSSSGAPSGESENDEKKGFSKYQILGIVLGIVGLLLLLSLLIFMSKKRKKSRSRNK